MRREGGRAWRWLLGMRGRRGRRWWRMCGMGRFECRDSGLRRLCWGIFLLLRKRVRRKYPNQYRLHLVSPPPPPPPPPPHPPHPHLSRDQSTTNQTTIPTHKHSRFNPSVKNRQQKRDCKNETLSAATIKNYSEFNHTSFTRKVWGEGGI